MKDPRTMAHRCSWLTSGLITLTAMFLHPCTAADGAPGVPHGDALPLVQKYCFECHADGSKKGGIALDEMLRTGPSKGRNDDWVRVWKITRHGFMPPAGADSPSGEERRQIAAWLATTRLNVDFANPDPGRVTLRRLNRMEYEFTVHDLFGADLSIQADYSSDLPSSSSATLRLRDRLPPDDTAFGFDNIGDFLTLTPSLLDRFFEISESIVQQVIVLDGPKAPLRTHNSEAFAGGKPNGNKRTEQLLTVTAPHTGRYRVEIQFNLGGWQEYGGAYDFSARLGTNEWVREKVEIGGQKTYRFTTETQLPAGDHPLVLANTPVTPDAKKALNPLRLNPTVKVLGPLEPQFAEYPETHRRLFFNGDAPADPDARRLYARQILERVASRAFRRPVEPETLDSLVELAGRSPQFERGIAQSLTAILTSPKFLFRLEAQPRPDDPATIHPLDDYALASRLSYLLWLSLPDEELTRLAAQGSLRRELKQQVRRMLEDPKSSRFFEDFPGQWLRTRNVLLTSIVAGNIGRLDPVRSAMKRETEMLFEHIARNDRDLVELITADYTFLDRKLGEYYGITNVPEKGFHRISLPAESRRGGILTHGSFLVGTSNPNRTSPVKRGLFVLENLLAIEPPPPPPDVPALDDVNIGDTSKKSGRELLALHRENKACAACHAHFDPIGIALENFDLAGLWRDTEEGRPIDPVEKTISGDRLSGPGDIRALFARDKNPLYRGVTEKFLTYTLGRGLEPADSVTADRIATQVAADGGKFSTLIQEIVGSRAFQYRRGDAGGGRHALRQAIPPIPPPEKRRPPKKVSPDEASGRDSKKSKTFPVDKATNAPSP